MSGTSQTSEYITVSGTHLSESHTFPIQGNGITNKPWLPWPWSKIRFQQHVIRSFSKHADKLIDMITKLENVKNEYERLKINTVGIENHARAMAKIVESQDVKIEDCEKRIRAYEKAVQGLNETIRQLKEKRKPAKAKLQRVRVSSKRNSS